MAALAIASWPIPTDLVSLGRVAAAQLGMPCQLFEADPLLEPASWSQGTPSPMSLGPLLSDGQGAAEKQHLLDNAGYSRSGWTFESVRRCP